MKKENFIHIGAWMVENLKLSWNELLIYAIIYGFSQDGRNCYNGSQNYLAKWIGSTRWTAVNILNKLVKKWLIEKKDILKWWAKYCEYRATINKNDDFPEEENHEEDNIEKEKERIENKIKAIKIKKDLEEYKFVDDFINKENPTIQYLTQNENRLLNQYKSIDLLNKDWYSNEAIQLALQYIKQDDFRSKNILTIEKLRRKNKDGVPYIVVILELIKKRKPKIIDLDK